MLYNHDQGLVVAYIRNGEVCYRNYCQQPDGQSTLWEIEKTVTALPSPAQNVSLFRTNDYRLGIMCESAGQMHWVITERNWALMAIEDHTVSVGFTEPIVELLPITYQEAHDEHTLNIGFTEPQVMFCPAIWPQVVAITNDEEETILIECDIPLHGDLTGLETAFTIEDGIGTPYSVISTYKANDRFIVLSVQNISTSSGDLTVTYNSETAPIYAQVEGGCLMELSSFVQDFTPDIEKEEYREHVLTAGFTNAIVDLKQVTYKDAHHESTVSIGFTNAIVDLIHINDINP